MPTKPLLPFSLPALVLALFSTGSLSGRESDVDEIDAPADAKPSKIALLTSGKGMRYFLRVPRSYKESDGTRLVVFLHGSNMNGLQYLQTFEAQRWCRDDILLCPNGEQGSTPYGANNFTFQSAPFVAEIAESLQAAFNITRAYLGGHSQGGFLTYSVLMHYPDLFDGAFPMAGDCWMQNEPNHWEDKPKTLTKQKKIAIAVIHGQKDPVVNISQGKHAYGVFLAMGYPKLRLFAPERLGHEFALSPVPEALDWLDAMSGLNPAASMNLAKDWFIDEEYGWAYQTASAVVAKKTAESRILANAKNAVAAVEKKAAEATNTMKDSLASKDARDWLPEWFEFRRQFGSTEAAQPLVAEYDSARAKERDQGAELFRKAVAHRRAKEEEAMKRGLEQILETAPHSFHAWYALDWLEEQ